MKQALPAGTTYGDLFELAFCDLEIEPRMIAHTSPNLGNEHFKIGLADALSGTDDLPGLP